MRNLINTIRSWFCKHEFQYEEFEEEIYGSPEAKLPYRIKFSVSRTCKKCGWHISYNKFGT